MKIISKDGSNIKTTRLTGLIDVAVYFNSSDVSTFIWPFFRDSYEDLEMRWLSNPFVAKYIFM